MVDSLEKMMVSENELPTISFVIPAFNEEKRIKKCLDSIKAQDYPQEKIEIILVDDDSGDKTVEIARSYGALVLRNGEHNIERGKSIGVQNARGDYVLLMDADNSLTGTEWLITAMDSLLENPEAVGAQSAWFDYRRDDYLANRYCSLFGINDPFAFYLKKRDKLTWYERDWRINGDTIKSTGSYFLVRFSKENMPTIGSQGYLVSKKLVMSTDYKPFLFHMEMNLELIKSGKDVFSMLKNTVVHDHCRTVGGLLKKLKRNFALFLEQKHMRTYRWESSRIEQAWALLSMVTVVRPLVDSIRGFSKIRDPAWFLHPFVCVAVPAMYGYLSVKWLFTRGLLKSKGTG